MTTGLGAPVAPAAAPSRAGGPALDAGTWFDAPTPFGALRLCAFSGQAVRNAAEAALALERCETLLESLHAWTGLALDWRWSPKAPRRPAGSHAAACWEPGAAPDAEAAPRELLCLLSLPWALLRAAAPPDGMLATHLRWPSVPGVLVLAQPVLDSDELALLEPGGALVLPPSLHAPWLGRLRTADEAADAGVPVLLEQPSLPRLLRTGAADVAPAPAAHEAPRRGRIACEARLALPNTLPGDRFTGWHDGQALGEAGSRATLWRCATDDAPAEQLAAGRLMPWGDGWALAIDDMPGAGAAASQMI